jgi:hypothetical protein
VVFKIGMRVSTWYLKLLFYGGVIEDRMAFILERDCHLMREAFGRHAIRPDASWINPSLHFSHLLLRMAREDKR